MIQRLLLICTLVLLISNNSNAQIKLPKQFNCILSEDSWRENHFFDGTYKFLTAAWGNGAVESQEELKPYLESLYDNLSFKFTKDGLIWGTGKQNGKYYYIVGIPGSLTTVTLSSSKNGIQFSNFSTWLLQQVRNNIKSNKDFYLTDYVGKTCSAND